MESNPESLHVVDKLDRDDEVQFLVKYLENDFIHSKSDPQQSSFVLNLTAGWGHGKTYFLKLLAQELRTNHFVAYFDAWENDHSDDALTSFFAELTLELHEFTKQFDSSDDGNIDSKTLATAAKIGDAITTIARKGAPIIAAHWAKRLTGITTDVFSDALNNNDESAPAVQGTDSSMENATVSYTHLTLPTKA